MAASELTTFDEFHRAIDPLASEPAGLAGDVGRFAVYDLAELYRNGPPPAMPYNRRTYYKISLIAGNNRAEYADRVLEVHRPALLFATPHIPYHWVPLDEHPRALFCVFTRDFLTAGSTTGQRLDRLPIFRPGGVPLFEVSDAQADLVAGIFAKMRREAASKYAYRDDLLRAYLLELIHTGQKLQPEAAPARTVSAAERTTALFRELLERQFMGLSPEEPLHLRTPGDFADRLSLHVNYLNQVLKAGTGRTTSQLIGERIVTEAKVLLRHSPLTVSEIAYRLGFEEVAHFSNFFKRHTQLAPLAYRG